MTTFTLPYGQSHLDFELPDACPADLIEPSLVAGAENPTLAVEEALDAPIHAPRLEKFSGSKSAAVAVNDKTRPVPYEYLLPPLLQRLEASGIAPERITLIIATGLHPVIHAEDWASFIPRNVLERYSVVCHDADEREDLSSLGTTQRGTPVWVNRRFLQADLRIVTGNVEPHQFQGFSGGAKGAAIGLAGRATIDHNHSLMLDPNARLGLFHGNPAREDVEEIGRRIGIHFALNAILGEKREIVRVLAGDPHALMDVGIPIVRTTCQVRVQHPYDLVIASPGGHPKDINLYQSQKALAHASLITRDHGTIILVAACAEGSGSQDYEVWVNGVSSHKEVFERFKQEGFRVGPHKAFQIARDGCRIRVLLFSEMPPDSVRRLLLTPVAELNEAVALGLKGIEGSKARIGVMPRANETIPCLV